MHCTAYNLHMVFLSCIGYIFHITRIDLLNVKQVILIKGLALHTHKELIGTP